MRSKSGSNPESSIVKYIHMHSLYGNSWQPGRRRKIIPGFSLLPLLVLSLLFSPLSAETLGDLVPPEQNEKASTLKDVPGEKKEEKKPTTQADATEAKSSQPVAGTATTAPEGPSRIGAHVRSALWPGWGQFYQKRDNWGYLYSLAYGLLWVNQLRFEIESQQLKKIYENDSEELFTNLMSTTFFQTSTRGSLADAMMLVQLNKIRGSRDNYATGIKNVNHGYMAILTLMAINQFDVFFFHPKKTSVKVTLLPGENRSMNLVAVFRF